MYFKGALLQTKTLRQESSNSSRHPPQASSLKEDSRWIKTVIQQEHLKPLEVSRDFVLDFERRERENADHLANQVFTVVHALICIYFWDVSLI